MERGGAKSRLGEMKSEHQNSLGGEVIRLPSRLFFFYEYLLAAGSGLDRTKIKHLLKIFSLLQYKKNFLIQDFCEEEDAECLAHFAPTQNAPNTRSRIVPSH
ncbi:MAG: hypothetical protein KKH11_02155 [Candidatus Omnitrophica bacterium]|nr:hypothetical protein [Candidatus Omnitrophota bacterium]